MHGLRRTRDLWIHGSCILLLAAAGHGHAAGQVAAQRPVETAGAVMVTACPELPATRPPDLRIRLARPSYSTPENLGRWDIVALGTQCPPDEIPGHLRHLYSAPHCVHVEPVEFGRLFTSLQNHRFGQLRMRPLPLTPHRAGYAVYLHWAGRSCFVSNVLGEHEVAAADRRDFDAIVREVVELIQRVGSRPPP